MQPSANYLLENMKLQLDLHDKLLSIFDRKDRAVREREIRGLEAVMAEEHGVVGKIRHLTEVRSVIMERFAGKCGLPAEEVKLSSIGKSLDGHFREVFSRTLQDLSETARRIIEVDNLNVNVITRPDRHLDRLMEVVVEDTNKVPVRDSLQDEKKWRSLSNGGGGLAGNFKQPSSLILLLPGGPIKT